MIQCNKIAIFCILGHYRRISKTYQYFSMYIINECCKYKLILLPIRIIKSADFSTL